MKSVSPRARLDQMQPPCHCFPKPCNMSEETYLYGSQSSQKLAKTWLAIGMQYFHLAFCFYSSNINLPPLGQALNTGWIMQTLWNLSPVCGNFIVLVLVQERMNKYLSCLTNIESIYFLLVNKLCSWYLKAQPDTALYIWEQTFSMQSHQRACLVLETHTLKEPVTWWPPLTLLSPGNSSLITRWLRRDSHLLKGPMS